MRTDLQVLQQLHDWATGWDNVRAVVLSGSRADPRREPDELSDYDVTVLIRELEPVQEDSWLGTLGNVMVRWPLIPRATFDLDCITQLVLFTDGVRVDFQFAISGSALSVERPGNYFCVLVDKDRMSDDLIAEPPAGRGIDPPSPEEFADRINAFWWDIPYVAKALRRDELDFAKYMLDSNIRFKKLHPLLRWNIGSRDGWEADVGIYGRWLDRYLDGESWQHYLRTFAGADIEDNWRALFATISFVDSIGRQLASDLGFEYPASIAEQVTGYVRSIAPDGARSPGEKWE